MDTLTINPGNPTGRTYTRHLIQGYEYPLIYFYPVTRSSLCLGCFLFPHLSYTTAREPTNEPQNLFYLSDVHRYCLSATNGI